jgi:hypothetical protein
MPKYNWDERYYIPIDTPPSKAAELYSLNTLQFREEHQRFVNRLILFYANFMNIPSEVCFYPDNDEVTSKKASLRIGSYDTDRFGPRNLPHLAGVNPAFLFAGHKGDNPGPRTNQILHQDIDAAELPDGHAYSVSNNPLLRDHSKPSSIFFPLTTEGRRVIMGKKPLLVPYGKILIWQGDVVHSGYTTDPELITDGNWRWYSAFHMYVSSTLHPVDLKQFRIDVDSVAHHQPQLMGQLLAKEAAPACARLGSIACQAFEAAMSNPGGNQTVGRELDIVIGRLQELRLAHPSKSSVTIAAAKTRPNKKQKTANAATPDEEGGAVPPEDNPIDAVPPDEDDEEEGAAPPEDNPIDAPINIRGGGLIEDDTDARKVLQRVENGCQIDSILGDGNCGYRSFIRVLQALALVAKTMGISEVRRLIFEYGEEHVDDYVGTGKAGADSCFLLKSGEVGWSFACTKLRNPEELRRKYFNNTTLCGIYSHKINYENGVGRRHWMNARLVLPIAVRAFQVPKLVLYTCMNSDGANLNAEGEKKKMFFTDVYTLDDGTVYFERSRGVVEHRDVPVCMVFFAYMDHFEVLVRKDDGEVKVGK